MLSVGVAIFPIGKENPMQMANGNRFFYVGSALLLKLQSRNYFFIPLSVTFAGW